MGTILGNRFIPQNPTPKQLEYLLYADEEALYGGAAGGGKSSALLMAALQYVEETNYAALILRRTYADLALPEALMPRAESWLGGKARWHDGTKTWTFPAGPTLTFGYLETERDKYRYQGSAFQFIGFDELTQFTETQYRYLFSRLRRPEGSTIPLRMRSASNPGGVGHEWVKLYLVEQPGKFFPARLIDNPYLDRETYIKTLQHLDPITRAQLLDGNWGIVESGGLFEKQWFRIVGEAPTDTLWVRWWDLAATNPRPGTDPDWTVGGLVGLHRGRWYVGDVKRMRGTPGDVELLIRQTAELDGRLISVRMEQEPGSSGVNTIDHYRRQVLAGWDFDGVRSTGSKVERARPASSAAHAGNISLVRGPWIPEFLDEVHAFPQGGHDDQVDVLSGAIGVLSLEPDQTLVEETRVEISPF